MSPLTVRRYRAERLLRVEFAALRGSVLGAVRKRLSASGVVLDQADLDACYAMAWQGLYMAVLDGQQIENPAGWLVLASFRRAIEEHRARRRRAEPRRHEPRTTDDAEVDVDFAGELDDRIRLRQLFEGLGARLGAREREAAVLCYLQGLTRAEAAERMGISESRMGKLMDGRGPGRPGVAAKVGALTQTIREGAWCEEQASLMRGFAFGLHDPDGERHGRALRHCRECPACRAYVASLRGLAAALPPVLLPFGVGAGVLGHLGGAGPGVAGPGVGAGVGAGRGIATALGAPAAGAGGVTGGGWLMSGPLGAKLAVSCLLVLGVGACTEELGVGPHAPGKRHGVVRRAERVSRRAATGPLATPSAEAAVQPRAVAAAPPVTLAVRQPTPITRAAREFGPESSLTAGAASQPSVSVSTARVASTAREAASASAAPASVGAPVARASKAAREFAPG